MDNEEMLSCWIVDEEMEKLAKQFYIELMILEEDNGPETTANTR